MSVRTYHDSNSRLRALVIPASYSVQGIEFLTASDQSQQMGIMRRPEGYRVDPHEHKVQSRIITDTNEVLFVRSGLIEIELFNENHEVTDRFELGPGDAVLLGAGGHGVRFMVESEVLEVKQGPYSQVQDKVRFTVDE